jgi:RNA polymerase sigma-70 factor (ECF subfamily)
LVRSHGGRLLRTTRRILLNEEDARDAVQDAFLSAVRSIERFRGDAELSTWLHRIAINAALVKLRSRLRVRERPIEGFLPDFRPDGEHLAPVHLWNEACDANLQRQETHDLVHAAIERLPDDYRVILLLRDLEGLDTRETADLLGISLDAVKTRLHRARQALRTLLDPHLRGDGP